MLSFAYVVSALAGNGRVLGGLQEGDDDLFLPKVEQQRVERQRLVCDIQTV